MNKKVSKILLLIICLLPFLGKLEVIKESDRAKEESIYYSFQVPSKSDCKTTGTLTGVKVPNTDIIRIEGNFHLGANKNNSNYLLKSQPKVNFDQSIKLIFTKNSSFFETSCHQKLPLYILNQVYRI